jgi:hypothetical protein
MNRTTRWLDECLVRGNPDVLLDLLPGSSNDHGSRETITRPPSIQSFIVGISLRVRSIPTLDPSRSRDIGSALGRSSSFRVAARGRIDGAASRGIDSTYWLNTGESERLHDG